MKKAILMAVAAMAAVLMMAPAAYAQEDSMMMESSGMMEDSMMMESSGMMEDSMMMESSGMMEEETTSGMGTSDSDLPDSGGPAILLPAAALLLGAGILTFAVVRRK